MLTESQTPGTRSFRSVTIIRHSSSECFTLPTPSALLALRRQPYKRKRKYLKSRNTRSLNVLELQGSASWCFQPKYDEKGVKFVKWTYILL